ncbi:MAG: FAD-dependent oxidoreductase [Candidatus Zeuxoniibacter abyssi]|nr:MAG: FAD-dependent oxidoreductase [Candidatus Persebacteraceae bacterium AB1(2)]
MTDVLIVGAAAAGLAAASAAAESQLSTVLLEADLRIGGRAHTVTLCPVARLIWVVIICIQFELNPLTDWLDEFGFSYEKTTWVSHYYRKNVLLPDDEVAQYKNYQEQCSARYSAALKERRDVAMESLVDGDSPWRSLYRSYRGLLHSRDWEQVSAYDAPRYRDIGEDWAILDGLGALVCAYGKNLGAVLDCPVYSLDWLGDGVTAKTAKGDIQAKCAVITVSTAIIAEQLLRFNPPLPDEFLSAAQSLPMGNYKHLYAVMPVRGESFNAQQCFAGEELYMKIRPFRHPYVNACVAGAQADEMDAWTEPNYTLFYEMPAGIFWVTMPPKNWALSKPVIGGKANGCAALTPPPFPATVIKERCLCNRWIIVYILSAKRQHRIL